MKTIVIALAGAGESVHEEGEARTAFELAKIPNLHHFAKTGKIGEVPLFSARYGAYPDVALLSLLGYDADQDYPGRGPLEAANLELKLEDDEIPFRMNFVTEYDGKLSDPEAGDISTKEAKALVNFLNKKVSSDFVRFFPGVGYRHVMVIKDAQGFEALSAKTECPHDIVGETIDSHLPKGAGGELLKKQMYDAKLLLQDHEINQVRVDLGENPANMIWVWGQGRRKKLEKFQDRFGVQGSLITNVTYAKGLARLLGLTVIDLPREEELSDDYERKGQALLTELEEKDFVCLFLTEGDEAARRGDLRDKIAALEAADYFIFSKIKDYLEKDGDVRVLITPCYAMPCATRKREKSPAPFILVGKNVMADDSQKFSEVSAKASEYKVNKSEDLMPFFLGK